MIYGGDKWNLICFSDADGKITITDYLQVKAHILGKSQIKPTSVPKEEEKPASPAGRSEPPAIAKVPAQQKPAVSTAVRAFLLPEKAFFPARRIVTKVR